MKFVYCLVAILLISLVRCTVESPLAEKVVSSSKNSNRKVRQTSFGPELGYRGGYPYVGARIEHNDDMWSGLARGRVDTRGQWDLYGRLNVGRNDGLSGYLSGNVDSTGNYGVGLGLQYRFKKRSVDFNNEQFNVTLRADPCNFNVYDIDRDGVITMHEFHKIFGTSETAETMFNTLDMTTSDGILERDEFVAMSAKVITDCDSSLIKIT